MCSFVSHNVFNMINAWSVECGSGLEPGTEAASGDLAKSKLVILAVLYNLQVTKVNIR